MLLHDIPREQGFILTDEIKNAFRAFKYTFPDCEIQIRVVNGQIIQSGFLAVDGMDTPAGEWHWWETPTAAWYVVFSTNSQHLSYPEFDLTWITRVIYESA